MTKSSRYLWQKRWRVDAATMSAVHECGLVVRFAMQPATGISSPGLAANGQDTLRQLAGTHGGHNAPIMLTRLLREAAEVYKAPPHERPRLQRPSTTAA